MCVYVSVQINDWRYKPKNYWYFSILYWSSSQLLNPQYAMPFVEQQFHVKLVMLPGPVKTSVVFLPTSMTALSNEETLTINIRNQSRRVSKTQRQNITNNRDILEVCCKECSLTAFWDRKVCRDVTLRKVKASRPRSIRTALAESGMELEFWQNMESIIVMNKQWQGWNVSHSLFILN